MAAPVLAGFAERLYVELEPLAYDDEAHGHALAHYVAAVARMFQPVEDLSRDTDEGPGWSGLVTLTRSPDDALTWLGQLVGVDRLPNTTAAQHRQRIAETSGFRRGSVAALKGAARQFLTGTQAAIVRERYRFDQPGVDNPYRVEVVTYTPETPDEDRVRAALLEQKPAGLILTYRVLTGQDYEAVRTDNASYTAVRTRFPSYEALRSGLSSNVT